jgi:hypothetical protein
LDEAGLVTTSLAHAMRFHARIQAESRAGVLAANRSPALVHLNRKQHDFYTTAPVTVIPAEDLDARARDITRPGDRAVVAAARMPAPADKEATVRKDGITRQIYNWTIANPSATKADALAAWPSANPSTVSVQFSAARRASAQ